MVVPRLQQARVALNDLTEHLLNEVHVAQPLATVLRGTVHWLRDGDDVCRCLWESRQPSEQTHEVEEFHHVVVVALVVQIRLDSQAEEIVLVLELQRFADHGLE